MPGSPLVSSPEQADLLRLVRTLAERELAPRVAADEAAEQFPRDVLRTLGRAGLLGLPYPDHPPIGRIVFSGDVVFAGSVGRTDLPGGDQATMLRTLQDIVLALPDDTALLPGHGDQTTMAAERAQNPYLQPAFLRN